MERNDHRGLLVLGVVVVGVQVSVAASAAFVLDLTKPNLLDNGVVVLAYAVIEETNKLLGLLLAYETHKLLGGQDAIANLK